MYALLYVGYVMQREHLLKRMKRVLDTQRQMNILRANLQNCEEDVSSEAYKQMQQQL